MHAVENLVAIFNGPQLKSSMSLPSRSPTLSPSKHLSGNSTNRYSIGVVSQSFAAGPHYSIVKEIPSHRISLSAKPSIDHLPNLGQTLLKPLHLLLQTLFPLLACFPHLCV
jgi:hypothetical protein